MVLPGLSQAEMAQWHSEGYLVFKQLLADDIGWITEEFEKVVPGGDNDMEWNVARSGFSREGGMRPYDGTQSTTVVPTIDHSAQLCGLLDHPAILNVASSLLGEDFNYGSGDGHYYVGDTAWHPDEGNTIWGYEPGSEAFAIKVAFYLDPVRADTGALRVIPKSHLNGGTYRSEDGTLDPDFLAAIGDADSPLGKGSPENGNIALECDPGDLVVFNHKVLHSAWGGGTKRRMFTMNLTRHGHDAEGIAKVDRYMKAHSPTSHGFEIGGNYAATMLATACGTNIRRRTHLTQMAKRHHIVHGRPGEAFVGWDAVEEKTQGRAQAQARL